MTMLPIDPSELRPISTADFLALRSRLYEPQAARELVERKSATERATVIAKARALSDAFNARFANEVACREWVAAIKAKFDANTLPPSTPAAVASVMRTVAAKYGITVAALTGRGRFPSVVRPRQEAMYRVEIACPDLSLGAIGKIFGGRDHSTVMYGIRQHCKLNGIGQPKRTCAPKSGVSKPKLTPHEHYIARIASVHRMLEWSRGT